MFITIIKTHNRAEMAITEVPRATVIRLRKLTKRGEIGMLNANPKPEILDVSKLFVTLGNSISKMVAFTNKGTLDIMTIDDNRIGWIIGQICAWIRDRNIEWKINIAAKITCQYRKTYAIR